MKRSKSYFITFQWTLRCIVSVKTKEQLISAKLLVKNFYKQFHEYKHYNSVDKLSLDIALYNKREELNN